MRKEHSAQCSLNGDGICHIGTRPHRNIHNPIRWRPRPASPIAAALAGCVLAATNKAYMLSVLMLPFSAVIGWAVCSNRPLLRSPARYTGVVGARFVLSVCSGPLRAQNAVISKERSMQSGCPPLRGSDHPCTDSLDGRVGFHTPLVRATPRACL